MVVAQGNEGQNAAVVAAAARFRVKSAQRGEAMGRVREEQAEYAGGGEHAGDVRGDSGEAPDGCFVERAPHDKLLELRRRLVDTGCSGWGQTWSSVCDCGR